MKFILEKTDNCDIDEIWGLFNCVYEDMNDKSMFVLDDKSFIKEQIKRAGFAVKVVTDEKKTAGCLVIRIPQMEEDNLGYDLNLPLEDLEKVVHMEIVAVLKEFRGNNLQKKMILYAEQILQEMYNEKFKYYLATAAPQNCASVRSFTDCGYKVMMRKKKYGGKDRYILCKKR